MENSRLSAAVESSPRRHSLAVFDAHHPPDNDLISECVHCGFCLTTCPTYRLWGEEADSPRGRIYLMKLGLDGEAALDDAYVGHFDRCLGCMACLTSCPSGVQYDKLIEATRAQIQRRHPRSASERLLRWFIFAIFPHPDRLRLLAIPLWFYQRMGFQKWVRRMGILKVLPERLRAMEKLAPQVSLRGLLGTSEEFATPSPGNHAASPGSLVPVRRGSPLARGPAAKSRMARSPARLAGPTAERVRVRARATDAKDPRPSPLPEYQERGQESRPPDRVPRLRVGVLLGCVQRVFFDEVNQATLRVLAAEGCELIIPAEQGCCGALMTHVGEETMAIEFARRTIDAFESANVEVIAINAAGCGSAMKEYGHLLRDDPAYAARAAALAEKCRDISEILAGLPPIAPRHPLAMRVAYHDACHLQHAQRITAQPRELLRGIPGLEILEIEDAAICCGSAGIYNLLEPAAARELGERKAQAVLNTGAQAVVSGNPGCTLQLRGSLQDTGRAMPVLHWVQLLDASIRGEEI